MLIFDETGRSWGLGKKIASGGDGTVYGLLDSSDYCAKLYHDVPMPPLKQVKLAAPANEAGRGFLRCCRLIH
jgi:DNA-binding helix-hairpin-helix protein with protein kinase domain